MNKTKVTIGLTNPKSPSNVGSVMRAAGCFGADEVYYTGQRYDIAAKFSTDTQNISDKILLEGVESLIDCADPQARIVCVELVEGATCLPDFKHPQNAHYIFGPEDGNISQAIIDQADEVVYLPTVGCLNLAATVNVVLYDRVAKADLSFAGDDLIRASRDVNNRAKVKR